MGVRSVCVFLATLLFAFTEAGASICAAQQMDPGEVVIVVTDAQTHAPLTNADVFLLGGEQPVSSLTNAQGKLTFREVPPGIYAVSVRHEGYIRYDTGSFDVNPHARVTLSVAMLLEMKTIASVTAHASASVSSEDMNASSAQRKISGTLSDALSKLAGVSVDDQIYGPDSAFNVSLRNHDASQTALSMDGIRIPSVAGNMIGAAQNLFTGASVSFAPTAGYVGGSVNFQTLRPSKLWTYDFKDTIGNYGAHTFNLAVTGTKGRLGIAIQHVGTGRNSFLSGLQYEDQSGQTYLHTGGNSAAADLVKLSYTLNKRTSLRLSTMFTSGQYDPICAQYTTLLPCGYGPGSSIASPGRWSTLSADSLIGNVDVTVSVYAPSGSSSYDYPQRYLNGVLSPYYSHTAYNGIGGYASGSITAKRHTDSVSMSLSQFGGTLTRPYNGQVLSVVQPPELQRDFGFSDRVKANEKLALTHGVSVESATNAGSSLVLSETADWTPAKADTFEAALSAGSAQPVYGLQFPITDVLAADYDCYNGSAYIDGPPDKAVRQSSLSYDLSWRHTYRGGNITIDAYRQNAYGQQMRAAVPVLAEPVNIFAGGLDAFLQRLQAAWASPAVCGSIPFDPSHIYISQMVTGLNQVHQGFTFSGRVGLGRNVAAFPTYAFGSAYLASTDPRLEVTGSYYAVGRQVPHRPLRTAGLTLDGVLPKSNLEWLANAQFTSINNGYDLPAYTTFNAGLVFHTKIGSLTLLDANIFGTRTGLFSTYQGVNPMPLFGGGTFAFASDPLPPRQWLLTWDIQWHQHTSRGP